MHIPSFSHRNVAASALIALMVFTLGFVLSNNKFYSSKESALLSQALPTTTPESMDKDSDVDGLPDWKERLYGADIYNKDSDGDGTSDGDEIRAGRNPIVANTAKQGEAPSDLLGYLQDANFATSSTDIAGIKKEFFTKFLAERSGEIKETTFRDLIKKEVGALQITPSLQLTDLNITADNSDAALREYVNGFGAFIAIYRVRSHRTEDEILVDAMKTKNSATLKELQLPAITYHNFVKDLLALKVPSSLASDHLLIVNGYEGMSKGLLAMQELFTRPIPGTAGYQAYSRYRLDVTAGYGKLVTTVIEKKLIFKSTEPGYPFYWNTVAAKKQ